MSAPEYEVESILSAKAQKRGKKQGWKFLVKWKGFDNSENTWEPVDSFQGSGDEALSRFWERVDLGGRDVRDLSQFKNGEEVFPRGPPEKPTSTADELKQDTEKSQSVAPDSEDELMLVPPGGPHSSPLGVKKTPKTVHFSGDADTDAMDVEEPSQVSREATSSSIPAHRLRAANPSIKRTEDEELGKSLKGAISSKVKAIFGSSNADASGSEAGASGSKSASGRPSKGLPQRNSSLLTFDKGGLKTLKRGRRTASDREVEGLVDKELTSSPERPSVDGQASNDVAPADISELSQPSLLQLAGLQPSEVDALPDFEDAGPQEVNGDAGETGTPAEVATDRAASKPLQFVSNMLNAVWGQSTIFGPFGLGSGSVNSLHKDEQDGDSATSSPYLLVLDPAKAIPITLKDVTPATSLDSPLLSTIIVPGPKGPPGKLYKGDHAMMLLKTMETGGSSARITPHDSAKEEDIALFNQFRDQLEGDSIFVAMAGAEILVCSASTNKAITQALGIPPAMQGLGKTLVVSHVKLADHSAFADAAMQTETVRWLTESVRVNKPFKPPSLNVTREQPQRKRRRVSYKDAQAADDDDDSDTNARSKRRKSTNDAYGEGPPPDNTQHYPVFKPKPFGEVFGARKYAIPVMKTKDGEVVRTVASNPSLGIRPQVNLIPRPLHDPMEDHAIVLYDPTIDDRETDEERKEREKEEAKTKAAKEAMEKNVGLYNPHKSLKELLGGGKEKKKGNDKVPVVIDPRLCKVLRPHQVEGVKFLYRCTTGMVVENQYGCIMADEMGLGKTLQCIALLWTLIKQSPHAGKPTIDKCIIACPSSLVKNWANELVKWLGKDAITALAVDGKGSKADLLERVARWVAASGRNVTQPVMIVSYETLRTLTVHLANCKIGLLLCDEGHRLKNSESLTFQALDSLDVKRRVILSGTPIQNDLSEYFSLLNFAKPNFLGSKMDFRKNFENVIIRGRDADATDKSRADCEKKLKELGDLVSKFIIRRTNDLLSKYLPVKYEQVVFCGLSDFQLSLYRLFISSPEIKALLRGAESQPLKAINILKKLCNHPELLDLPKDLHGSDNLIPEGFCGAGSSSNSRGRGTVPAVHAEWSGKFLVLERFLHRIRTETTDKIVLISNYTQTLDIFERLMRSKKYGYFRLDGTMSIPKRQKLVDQFNNPEGKEFVFLLSSKAGGCGINLIGANRLILFDPDWNPAADQQALARVWRDAFVADFLRGFVYRFISTGTIEEKIFQRQASKQALSSAVVDEKENAERHFSLDSLRQLFLFNEKTLCETHETFKCKRCKNGKQMIKAPALLYGDASTWNHFTNAELKSNHDDLLRAEVGLPEVSFVFQYISH
ncbi:hypothetical protein EWM64_g2452 [Hericium alpestre]|uniref:DNA repair protein n=1 Tax=Hericium alpestre TaxID=135208 RepID=A0A4Z0A3G9_9AGAM|nr:hypothetical protein EWM64_g2452 [Hericium alpestre]